jgi:hypothetical protein
VLMSTMGASQMWHFWGAGSSLTSFCMNNR